jgi:hypothetical protein
MTKRLPDFFIAGTMKGGTTGLYGALCHHPQMWPRLPKEIHYYSLHHDRGSDWYASFFRDCPRGLLTGEASPTYFDTCTLAPTVERMRADHASTPCLVLLRDPVERAISHFFHERQHDPSVTSTLEAEEFFSAENIAGITRPGLEEDPRQTSMLAAVLRASLYKSKLERFAAGMPATLVVRQECLANPQFTSELSREICLHVGLPPRLLDLSESRGQGSYDHGRSSAPHYHRLAEFFAAERAWMDNFFAGAAFRHAVAPPAPHDRFSAYKHQFLTAGREALAARTVLVIGAVPDTVRSLWKAQGYYRDALAGADASADIGADAGDLIVALDLLERQRTKEDFTATLHRILAAVDRHAFVSYFNPNITGLDPLPMSPTGNDARFFGDLQAIVRGDATSAHLQTVPVGRYGMQTIYQLTNTRSDEARQAGFFFFGERP